MKGGEIEINVSVKHKVFENEVSKEFENIYKWM
jgi:hypothetical protein